MINKTRQLILLSLITLFTNNAIAELPDNDQWVYANFIPEQIMFGINLYPLDPSAMCHIVNVVNGGNDSSSMVSYSYNGGIGGAVLNATTVSIKCRTTFTSYNDPSNPITYVNESTSGFSLEGSYECPSVNGADYTILGNGYGYSDKACYKPLECESPFTPEAFLGEGDQLAVALCTTECPVGVSFSAKLGRCDFLNEEKNQCDALVGNPVNAITGEKLETFIDFTQGGNLPLRVERSYASFRAEDSSSKQYENLPSNKKQTIVQPAGYKTPNIGYFEIIDKAKQGHVQWRHNYQFFLAKYEGENVVITLQDKSQRKFTYNNELYSAVLPIGDQLSKTLNGWIYKNTSGIIYEFDNQGYLKEIQHSSGESLSLIYNVNNSLQSVTNIYGETLNYQYSNNIISSITLPNNDAIVFNYDTHNNLSEVVYPDNTKEIYHYEDSQNPYSLTGVTDRLNIRYASWTYNNAGKATSSYHINGNDLTNIEYDNENLKSIVTNSKGKNKTLTYNSSGLLTHLSGESCSTSGQSSSKDIYYHSNGTKQFTVDQDGLVDSIKWFNFNGAAEGLPNKIQKALSTNNEQTTSIIYDDGTLKPAQITHPNGAIETFIYGNNGRVESHSMTDGSETRTTSYAYNNDDLLTSIDGSLANNDILTISYNINNRVSSVSNGLGHTTTFENYDMFGNATKITDSNGVITLLTYDTEGRLININNSGRITQFDYDAIGQLIKTTESSGGYLQYTYDGARRLTDITNNVGDSIHFNIDSEGNITQKDIIGSDTNISFTQQLIYDNVNRLSQTISSTNQTWTNEYDIAGNLIKKITPASTELENTFDQLKRTTKQLDQADSATNYQYNKLDQLTKVTDSLGRETTYQYNKFGERTSQVSNDSGSTTSTYDLAGNLATQTDARGVITTYNYDALSRVTSISYSDNPNATANFIYDNAEVGRYGIGQLTRVEKTFDSTDYYYNQYGEMVKEVITVNRQAADPNDIQTYTTEYSFNVDGQLKGVTYPSGRIFSYTYNTIGLISQVTTTYNGVTQTLASAISYLPFGEMNSLTYGNGKILTQSYNQNYQLTDKVITGIVDKTYVYDLVNNIDSITDNLNTNETESFIYNNVDRLTQATGSYGNFSFSYDTVGNRLSKTENNNTTSYVYQNNSQLTSLTGTTNTVMTYDARGNLLNKGSDNFTYDSEARLTSATVNNTTTDYHYNYRGQRIAKQFQNGELRYYVYDLQGLLIAELNSNAQTQIEYVYLNGKRIALLVNATSTTPYYVHTNHLDAPLAISDTSGNTVWQASYTPFGDIEITLDTLPENLTARFPGQYSDTTTGFYYNYFRDYDPELGRYIQSDPIGLAGGINTYGYVGGNPISYTDPSGLCPWCAAGFAIGVWSNIGAQLYENGGSWGELDAGQVILSGLGGALSGGLGTITSGMGITMNMLTNSAGSALISSGLTVANNAIEGQCLTDNVGNNAKKGALFGFVGAGLGNSFNAYRQAQNSSRFLNTSNSVSGPYYPSIYKNWAPGGTISGNVISNLISNGNQ